MCDIRYFRRAFLDYRAAENLLKEPENDEAYMNAVAYHLQQAVEKTLKAFLECVGVTVPNTHDIDKLARMTRDNGSAAVLTGARFLYRRVAGEEYLAAFSSFIQFLLTQSMGKR